MSKNTIPAIEELKLASLVRDIALSGRTEKELKENAKEKWQELQAFGGWDAHQPGQYFKRGGKNHLLAGFSRVEAGLANDLKTGFFVEVADDASKLRTACIRTNTGKKPSMMEQGRIYSQMRGGTNAETAKEGEAIFEPMKIVDVAKEIGCTRQHIDQCIAVFENPTEIAELIINGSVAASVVLRAKQLQKDEGKLIKWLKAAIKSAVSEGKECATLKHLDAHRADFAPLKAKKTETPPPSKSNPPKEEWRGDDGESSESEEGKGERDTEAFIIPLETTHLVSTEMKPSGPKHVVSMPQSEMDLGSATPAPEKPKASAKKRRAQLMEICGKWQDELRYSVENPDIERLIDAIMAAELPF